jgi:hypothetical protein
MGNVVLPRLIARGYPKKGWQDGMWINMSICMGMKTLILHTPFFNSGFGGVNIQLHQQTLAP